MKPKKGDVVSITDWRDIIGQVVSYNKRNKELVLEWPNDLFWAGPNPQPFHLVELDNIKVLSPKDVLHIMSEKFAE